MQSCSNILLIRPVSFNFNPETSASNAFQKRTRGAEPEKIQREAMDEFDFFTAQLREAGINLHVFQDTPVPQKPDAVFPNNWVSFHPDGKVILYPMLSPARRMERRADIIEEMKKKFIVKEIIDLSVFENENRYLEGTGSIVFDHENKVAYACLSSRTDQGLFLDVSGLLGYDPLFFHACDRSGQEIYHTNVMLCIGKEFAVICLESIGSAFEREAVVNSLSKTGHQLIEISADQMHHFAGNMLEVQNRDKKNIILLSRSALEILTAGQKKEIEKHCKMLSVPIPTIETTGGGSVRCMMAEVFLPEKKQGAAI